MEHKKGIKERLIEEILDDNHKKEITMLDDRELETKGIKFKFCNRCARITLQKDGNCSICKK